MSESAEPSNQPDNKAPEGNRKLPVDGNVAGRLSMVASLAPGAIAIAEPDGPPQPDGNRSYALTTFGALDQRSDEIAKGLIEWGVKPGMRIAMLVPFGAGFIELVFALMKAGVVTVLVDPGMGPNTWFAVSVMPTRMDSSAFPKRSGANDFAVKISKSEMERDGWPSLFWGGKTLQQIIDQGKKVGKDTSLPRIDALTKQPSFSQREALAPEGCALHSRRFPCPDRSYQGTIRHSSWSQGSCLLSPLWSFRRGDGRNHHHSGHGSHQTSPSQSRTFGRGGSPMGGRTGVRIACALEHGCTLGRNQETTSPFSDPQTRTLAGAPVPAETLIKLRKLVDPDANIMTPYGATEALPLASIESREVIAETGPASLKGKGTCVGTRFEGVAWKVIEIEDGPLDDISETQEVSRGKIGELMVTGPMVTQRYVVRSDQNPFHKVTDGDRIWHRMGDVGYLDEETVFGSVDEKHIAQRWEEDPLYGALRGHFNEHPAIYRSALVGRGNRPNQQPVMIVEPINRT